MLLYIYLFGFWIVLRHCLSPVRISKRVDKYGHNWIWISYVCVCIHRSDILSQRSVSGEMIGLPHLKIISFDSERPTPLNLLLLLACYRSNIPTLLNTTKRDPFI